jgi:hypothetical protein
MLRRLALFHWCILGLIGLLLVFAIARPFAARAAVTLVDMTATAQSDGTILVKWETATELNTLAFRLYRAPVSIGPWDTIVNTQAAQGDGISGAVYAFADHGVEVGKVYYYLLEEVDNSNTRTPLAIRSATVLAPGQSTFTPTFTSTPIRTRTPTPTDWPTATPQATNTPTPTGTPAADHIIYLPWFLRAN